MTTSSILYLHYEAPKRRRETGKVAENIFENVIAENFPNLGKETDIQVQKVQRVPNRINPKRTIQRHTVIKMEQIKDKKKKY